MFLLVWSEDHRDQVPSIPEINIVRARKVLRWLRIRAVGDDHRLGTCIHLLSGDDFLDRFHADSLGVSFRLDGSTNAMFADNQIGTKVAARWCMLDNVAMSLKQADQVPFKRYPIHVVDLRHARASEPPCLVHGNGDSDQ